MWRAFFGWRGRSAKGERGDEGEEADSLHRAAKRWERSNLQILKLPILPLVFDMLCQRRIVWTCGFYMRCRTSSHYGED